MVQHQAPSPDLAPSDIHLFGLHKNGTYHGSSGYDNVIVAVTNWLQVFVKGFNAWFPAGICATTQVAIM
jgi:hypothetical protein